MNLKCCIYKSLFLFFIFFRMNEMEVKFQKQLLIESVKLTTSNDIKDSTENQLIKPTDEIVQIQRLTILF